MAIIDIILAPISVISEGFPISIFKALQLPLIFRLSLISGTALAAESVLFDLSLSEPLFDFLVTKSRYILFFASAAAF